MKLRFYGVRLYTDANTYEAVIIVRKLSDSGYAEDGMRSTSLHSILTQVRHHIQTYLHTGRHI
jgi:hypothetical protein